jgi:hypothetical protein
VDRIRDPFPVDCEMDLNRLQSLLAVMLVMMTSWVNPVWAQKGQEATAHQDLLFSNQAFAARSLFSPHHSGGSPHLHQIEHQTVAALDPLLVEMGERWRKARFVEFSRAFLDRRNPYERLLKTLHKRLARGSFVRNLVGSLDKEHTRKDFLLDYLPIVPDAQLVLKGLALHVYDRFPQGIPPSVITYLKGLIQVYNESPDPQIVMPLDIPGLFVTALAGYFSDSDAFIEFSSRWESLPEPERTWALALSLFLEGSHRHSATRDRTDDLQTYAKKLRAAAQRLSAWQASGALLNEEIEALSTGVLRFMSYVAPFLTNHETVALNIFSNSIEAYKLQLSVAWADVSSVLREPLLAALSTAVPGSDLAMWDPFLMGLNILLYPYGEAKAFKVVGRSPVPLTRLFLLRSDPADRAYLTTLLWSIKKSEPAENTFKYNLNTGVHRQRHLQTFLLKNA